MTGISDRLTTALADRYRIERYRFEGEIYERLGERAHAAEAYGKFIDLWADGDPAAQAQVKAARERVGTLVAEPRS